MAYEIPYPEWTKEEKKILGANYENTGNDKGKRKKKKKSKSKKKDNFL